MASNRMDELFSRLEESSFAYADRATELSDMILEFEQRLHSVMKGKFSACVTREDQSICLSLAYMRLNSAWRLAFGVGKQDHGVRPLQDCSVKQKIYAVTLFEELLQDILDKQEGQTDELHKALDGISPFLDAETRQKGGE